MKIAVTGIGIVSGIGMNVEETLLALQEKKSGIGELTLFDSIHRDNTLVSEVKYNNTQLQEKLGISPEKIYSRTALLGMLAAHEAFLDSELNKRRQWRTGLISGTSVGGMDLSEQFYESFYQDQTSGNLRYIVSHDCADSTEKIADLLSVKDYVGTISTACSSAANAIMMGARLIRNNILDCAIVGGTDSLCKFTLNGFASLKILDNVTCRPLDESRAGLNLGEGAAYIVLERDDTDSPRTYAYLNGYANICEAYHQTASSPEGEGPFLSMKNALENAELKPSDIDYINFHGTGTPNNDLAEGNAVKKLFSEKLPLLSSTKSYTGHTLGAAGGIEGVFSVLAIDKGIVFPNLNFKNPVPEHGLIPVTEFRTGLNIRNVLSNSFGFGGNDTSLIFSKES